MSNRERAYVVAFCSECKKGRRRSGSDDPFHASVHFGPVCEHCGADHEGFRPRIETEVVRERFVPGRRWWNFGRWEDLS